MGIMNCKRISLYVAILLLIAALPARAGQVLKIMPLGDSNTRGTYMRGAGPWPASTGAGGYRYHLQNKLAAGKYSFDFVGSQTSNPVGEQGNNPPSTWVYDSAFDCDHQGLAGFTNTMLITGGTVPTLTNDPVNAAPSLVDCLTLYKPDIVLLMSGTNGLKSTNIDANLTSLDSVIRTIAANSPTTKVIVSTIYDRYGKIEKYDELYNATVTYNAGIPGLVAEAQKRGELVTFVDTAASLTYDDYLRDDGTLIDGIHPNGTKLYKPAEVWYEGIQAVAPAPEPKTSTLLLISAAFALCFAKRFGKTVR